jgi:hypothetical protein
VRGGTRTGGERDASGVAGDAEGVGGKMPLRTRLGPPGGVVVAAAVLALVWIVVNTPLLASVVGPLSIIKANGQLVIGLLIVGIFAYWALDELEEDDDATIAIKKTSERAADATGGFITVTRAAVAGVATIVLTAGDQLAATVVEAPLIVGQFAISALGVGAALGALPIGLLLVGAAAVIIGTALVSEVGA